MAVTVDGPSVVAATGPTAYHETGSRTPAAVPPFTPPGQPVEILVELRRGTGLLLGRFRTARFVAPCTKTLNGIGTTRFTWRPLPGLEPEVIPYLIRDGEPLTWRDADLEVWIYRAGELVWQGPVVFQKHRPRDGRLELAAWSREGYVKRLIYGGAGRRNYLQQGWFDLPGSLDQWTETGTVAATTTDPQYLYRRDASALMAFTSPGGNITTTIDQAALNHMSVAQFLIVARYESGNGWPEEPNSGRPLVGQVVRRLINPTTGVVVRRTVHPITVDDVSTMTPGGWVRATQPVRRETGYINRYSVVVFGIPGTTVVVGEVEMVYRSNIGAYGRDRFSAWVGELARNTVLYLNGDDWTRDIGTAGPVLGSNKNTYAEDHADFWSLWEDATDWGDWWCPVQPAREIRYRARRGRHRPELRIVGQQAATGLEVEWDGADPDVANDAVILSNGDDAPTREEGGATLPVTGARLMRCELAPPGALPRELDEIAARLLDAQGFVRRRLTATPARGPAANDEARRTIPGAWVHIIEPGDSTTVRQVDGALDYTIEPIVGDLAWDPEADVVSIGWITGAPTP